MEIISMEGSKLPLLAKRIRNSLDLREQSQEEWVTATLDLAAALAEARAHFKDHISFGRWCDECGFDISHQQRAGYIKIGQHLDVAREKLEATPSRSIELIAKREFRFTSARKTKKPRTAPGLTTTPETQKALDAYDAFKAAGIEPTQQQIEERAGLGDGSKAVRRAIERRRTEEALAKQDVDLSGFSQSATAKVEAAVRKIQKQMDAQFDRRLQQGIQAHVTEFVLPMYAEKLALADRIMAVGKKPFSIEEFRKLLAALHPDSSSPERRTEMFMIVKQRELLLRPADKDRPLSGDLPKTIEELLARRRKR